MIKFSVGVSFYQPFDTVFKKCTISDIVIKIEDGKTSVEILYYWGLHNWDTVDAAVAAKNINDKHWHF